MQAAKITEGTTITGYQVGVTEEPGARRAWRIHWPNTLQRRSRVSACATAASAVARIRKRHANHAIGIVTSTPAGAVETTRLGTEEDVALQDRLIE